MPNEILASNLPFLLHYLQMQEYLLFNFSMYFVGRCQALRGIQVRILSWIIYKVDKKKFDPFILDTDPLCALWRNILLLTSYSECAKYFKGTAQEYFCFSAELSIELFASQRWIGLGKVMSEYFNRNQISHQS